MAKCVRHACMCTGMISAGAEKHIIATAAWKNNIANTAFFHIAVSGPNL